MQQNSGFLKQLNMMKNIATDQYLWYKEVSSFDRVEEGGEKK